MWRKRVLDPLKLLGLCFKFQFPPSLGTRALGQVWVLSVSHDSQRQPVAVTGPVPPGTGQTGRAAWFVPGPGILVGFETSVQ